MKVHGVPGMSPPGRAFGGLLLLLVLAGCNQAEKLRPYLLSPNPRHQVMALRKILREGVNSTSLIGALSICMERDNPDISPLAARALGQLGEAAVPVLQRKLRSSKPETRWKAALGLFEAGEAAQAAKDELVNALNDEYPMVRQYAAMAIGKAQIVEAIPQLQACLSDEHPSVKQAASIALLNLGVIKRPDQKVQTIRRTTQTR